MGTRSLTTFIEKWKDEKTGKVKQVKIVTMYRQMDGYPEGHGMDLADFLVQGEVVNGIPAGSNKLLFNGMGCLSAQVVANFKQGSGGIYLHRGGTTNCGENYRYEVILEESNPKEIILRCYDTGSRKWIFEGTPQEFVTLFEEYQKQTVN